MAYKHKDKRDIKTASWVHATTPIEQQLDMMESGPMRGDEISHSHGVNNPDRLSADYNFDMAEENREGSEMSGDEHSSGLQGGGVENTGQRQQIGEMPGVDADRNIDTDTIDNEELDRTG